jgi:hypothetical protein
MKSQQGLALFVVWSAVAACALLTLLAPQAPQDRAAGAFVSLTRTAF